MSNIDRRPEYSLQINEKRERISTNPLSIVLYEWEHSPLDILSIDRISSRLTAELEAKPLGKNIVFVEEASGTESFVKKTKTRAKKFGGFANGLIAYGRTQDGIEPSLQHVTFLSRQIDSLPYEQALMSGLIPPIGVQIYYLYRSLDKLKSKYNFDIEFEYHDVSAVKRSKDLNDLIMSSYQRGTSYWSGAQFDKALDVEKELCTYVYQMAILREKGMVDKVNNIAKKTLRDGAGGMIFVLVGAAHRPIIDVLQRKLGYYQNIDFQVDENPYYRDSPRSKVYTKTREGEPVDDSLYAQSLFKGVCDNTIYGAFGNNLKLVVENYQTIFEAANSVTATLSLNDLRNLCLRGTSIWDFIRNHPLGVNLKNLR